MDNSVKTREQLMEECFERGLPVLENDSLETINALLDSDDFEEDEFYEYDDDLDEDEY